MGLRPINRIKHVVDLQQALPKSTQLPFDIVKAKDAPVITGESEVQTGATVHAIYANVQCVASETSTTATANTYLIFAKNPGNSLSFQDGNSIGDDVNKKFVIHQEMNMINPLDGGNPRVLFNGVIKLPKRYQRFGPDDKLIMYMFIPSTGVDINICGQFHYKEFR